jgi:hypothetical protein
MHTIFNKKNRKHERKKHIIHGQWNVIEIEGEKKPSKKIDNLFDEN